MTHLGMDAFRGLLKTCLYQLRREPSWATFHFSLYVCYLLPLLDVIIFLGPILWPYLYSTIFISTIFVFWIWQCSYSSSSLAFVLYLLPFTFFEYSYHPYGFTFFEAVFTIFPSAIIPTKAPCLHVNTCQLGSWLLFVCSCFICSSHLEPYSVQKLGNFLVQEVSLRSNLRENVQWLSTELRFIQSFLKDAEEKQVCDQRVQQWVFEINSIANDAVAILETYCFIAGDGDDHESASRLKSYDCFCWKETKFYNMGKEIQSLKERLMDISRRRDTYGIRNINNIAGEGPSSYRPNNQRSGVRRTTSYVDDQSFVGFQDVVERLLAELLKEEPCRSVISIYGMGGLGKTTLARNLYHSQSLTKEFHSRAWIYVSQQYSTQDLLHSIIKAIRGCNNLETFELLERMTETDLESHLRDLLKEQKYLLVVDDLWHVEAWESLKRALPESNKGSRVIITTRKEDVAVKANGFVHGLRFLTQEESWDLFCKKLLDVRAMVPAMESLARDMVDKCKGLPLAMVVLSGLLSHKKGLGEWQRVKEHLWGRLTDGSIEIRDILALSYNDLPTELKQCFLYFGIFPEDRIIPVIQIVRMWMAEGFIPSGEERMEDVAKDFLNELISRNLIQVENILWDSVRSCKIHDLHRELAIKKALEVNFFDIYDPKKHFISPLCLRHVIHSHGEKYLSLDIPNMKLRPVAIFDQENDMLVDKIKFQKKFKHLYVFHLENSYGTLPAAIGSLYHLKYISLGGGCKIPSSIGNLKNLQTFQVMGSCKLPPEIANLTNLRHLIANYLEPVQHISKLKSLQVLGGVKCDQWKYVDPVGLVNLQELVMVDINKAYSLSNISSLKNLSILTLRCLSESFPALEFLSSCHNLQKVRLEGRIETLPLFPNSIIMMVLWVSFLEKDPMPILGRLPNLRDLYLLRAYKGKEMTCAGNSFPQLEFLRLFGLEKLERWDLATSAMPLLKGFHIHNCPNLKEIPERIKGIPPILKI